MIYDLNLFFTLNYISKLVFCIYLQQYFSKLANKDLFVLCVIECLLTHLVTKQFQTVQIVFTRYNSCSCNQWCKRHLNDPNNPQLILV